MSLHITPQYQEQKQTLSSPKKALGTSSNLTPLVAVVVLLLLLAGFCMGLVDRSLHPAFLQHQVVTAPAAEINVPEALQLIDSSRGYDSKGEIKLNRYRTLLSLIHRGISDAKGEEATANVLVEAQRQLAAKGISESLLDIMEGTNVFLRPGSSNDTFLEYLVAYVLARSNMGDSHEQAVDFLRTMTPNLLHAFHTGKIHGDGKGNLVLETPQGPVTL